MKYKISLLFFLLFFISYVVLSFLNPEKVRLDVGFGKSLDTTVTNYIAASFVLGVIVSIFASFFGDARRGIMKWRRERKERERNEAKELLEKAKLLEMKGEPEKAAECFNRVLQSAPDLEEAYLAFSDMYSARGEHARAGEILDRGETRLGKSEQILLKKAQVHRAQEDLDGVEHDLKEALKIKESNLEAMAALRDLYVCRKAWTEALDVEEKVRKQIKTDDEDRRLAGLRYESAKERFEKDDPRLYEQILKDLREIIGDHKRFIPAYILSAEVYKKMDKLNDAGRVYGRGFAKTGHVIFLRQLEDLYLDKREPGVILKIYRRLLEVAPKNQLLMFLYARLCLKLEMIDEAIDILTTLLADEKEFRGLHRAMAEAYIHRGKFEEAVKEFSRAFPMSQVYIPFQCVKCNTVKAEWADFCDTCYSWSTINIKQDGLFEKEAEDLRVLYEENWEI
ncbi:MAG: tetratricopeptide repeat protein [Syntrophorhabdales bacterium]|jgi:tetratricopeptide (TPR) repeat protein